MANNYDAVTPRRGRYIYLDEETTGLDFLQDEITELAFITDEGDERSWCIDHRRLPHPEVIANSDYVQRILPAPKIPLWTALNVLAEVCGQLSADGSVVVLVGANPGFDDRFIRKALRKEPPYHYQPIAVGNLVQGLLGLDRCPVPPRLRECRALLGIPGEFTGQHTALGDAREVKLIVDFLRDLQRAREIVSALA